MARIKIVISGKIIEMSRNFLKKNGDHHHQNVAISHRIDPHMTLKGVCERL